MERRWLLKDGRGHPSWTATIVVPSAFAVTQKFLLAGVTIPVVGTFPPMTGGEYAAAIGALLAMWVGREYVDKPLDAKGGQGGNP